jgi:hypothetical protein
MTKGICMRRSASVFLIASLVNALLASASATETPSPKAQQAATFSIRDIAQAGLLDPLGEYYSYEAVSENENGWVVSFIASHCYQNDEIETCDPYQGREGDLEPDAWLAVAENDDAFEVTDAIGRFTDDQRDTLMDYSESSELEEAHALYPTVRLDPDRHESGYDIRAAGMWAGVLPAEGRTWTICRAEILDRNGDVVWTDRSDHAQGSRGEAFRSGWLVFIGAVEVEGADSATMTCANFSGETWRLKGEPSLDTSRKGYVGVYGPVKWMLGRLVSGLESSCDVEIFNRHGRSMKQMTKKGPTSPWTRRLHTKFSAVVRVRHAARARSASVFCHER